MLHIQTAYPFLSVDEPQDWRQKRAELSERYCQGARGRSTAGATTANRHCWLCWESQEAWVLPGSWLQLLSSRTALQRPLIAAINLASCWAHVEAETSESEEGLCRQGFGSAHRQQFVESYMLLPVMWQKQYSKAAFYMYLLGALGQAVRRRGSGRRNIF